MQPTTQSPFVRFLHCFSIITEKCEGYPDRLRHSAKTDLQIAECIGELWNLDEPLMKRLNKKFIEDSVPSDFGPAWNQYRADWREQVILVCICDDDEFGLFGTAPKQRSSPKSGRVVILPTNQGAPDLEQDEVFDPYITMEPQCSIGRRAISSII